ncbi:transaldolase [Diplogelasinospora grovesii]|uniref:Transaldolase n=1 Tax=Diplogelasinospora grovesii TaxID=303347 RepID=A0AAN6S5S6_9PEZI|nr:transaldolase [Diplogelasinospora grovesii]
MAQITWLDKLKEKVAVDVDWMDPGYIESMQPKIKFTDMTSNQLWVDVELGQPSNAEMIKQVATELKKELGDSDAEKLWLHIYTRAAVLLCKKTIDMISGRVLLQTLPSKAYDVEATLNHARLYDDEFARVGIGRDRYCIKIPSTGPALNAAHALQKLGIQTLGTALFCIPQAVAAAQAGCLYISPYYNENKAHTDRSLWPDVKDPAMEHPNSPRIVQILEMYNRHTPEGWQTSGDVRKNPVMKLASFISPEEVMGAAEMGCKSVTVSHTVLDELASRVYDPSAHPCLQEGDGKRLAKLLEIDPLSPDNKPIPIDEARYKTDYLDDANNGKPLDDAIAADPEAARRLKFALEMFIGAELKSKEKIEKVLAAL